MLFLLALVIAVSFSFLCAGVLKKHPLPFYIGGTVLSVIMTVLSGRHLDNAFLRTYAVGIFSGGAMAGALWAVVMGMRVLPDGSRAVKRLMPVRGELSIFAASITLSHIVNYGVTYIKRLADPRLRTGTELVLTCVVCIALTLIMLPLTVISFRKIRKKMDPRTWKKVQRAAYVFYGLIYLHVMIIFLPRARAGMKGYFTSCLAYTLVWGAYLVLRVRKHYVKTKKPESRSALNVACMACLAAMTGIIAFCSYGKAENRPSAARKASGTKSLSIRRDSSSDAVSVPDGSVSSETVSSTSSLDGSSQDDSSSESAESLSSSGDSSSSGPDSSLSSSESSSESDSSEEPQEEQPEEEEPEEEPHDSDEEQDQPAETEAPREEPPVTTTAETTTAAPPEPEYIYENGTYEAKAYGYDGYIHVTITIEDDLITDISAYTDEEETEYFDMAYELIGQDILDCQTYDVDAVSGATYSSEAIIKAVRKCLEQALR
ncbi:MAG: FMN-binding protein [Ruminococcus sp.]|nr:FMN-binding protein [Ruminococcus sp.]